MTDDIVERFFRAGFVVTIIAVGILLARSGPVEREDPLDKIQREAVERGFAEWETSTRMVDGQVILPADNQDVQMEGEGMSTGSEIGDKTYAAVLVSVGILLGTGPGLLVWTVASSAWIEMGRNEVREQAVKRGLAEYVEVERQLVVDKEIRNRVDRHFR